jgi:hypothetical protein
MTLMGRYRTLLLTTTLGLALVAGVARAQDGGSYAGEEIGTIRFIDRALNLVVLTDGNEFRATDPRMLGNLKEGDLVKVDFTHDNDRSIINSIEPADADSSSGASPTTEPGPHFHG